MRVSIFIGNARCQARSWQGNRPRTTLSSIPALDPLKQLAQALGQFTLALQTLHDPADDLHALAGADAQCIHGLVGRGRRAQTAVGRLIDLAEAAAGFVGGAFQALGDLHDLLAGVVGAHRQAAHLVGHHGKAAPCSPARAASMAAFSASRLVCRAMS